MPCFKQFKSLLSFSTGSWQLRHKFSLQLHVVISHLGDIIKVFEKGEDDWWKGEVNGKVGLFPANYIETEISV